MISLIPKKGSGLHGLAIFFVARLDYVTSIYYIKNKLVRMNPWILGIFL